MLYVEDLYAIAPIVVFMNYSTEFACIDVSKVADAISEVIIWQVYTERINGAIALKYDGVKTTPQTLYSSSLHFKLSALMSLRGAMITPTRSA